MTPEQDLISRLEQMGKKVPTAPTEGSEVENEMAKGDPDFSTPVTMRNLFTHHDAHPVVLDFALLKAFSNDWWAWEAETIWAEIQHIFSTQISELSKAKIRAIQTVHTSTMPWHRWQVFEKVAQALNNNVPIFNIIQPLSIEQLYVAVDIFDTLRTLPFSDEVKTYMSGCILNEQVLFVPPPLDFIQLEVSQPHYKCKDCGNAEGALFSDGHCSFCTERLHPEQGLSLAPKQEALEAGKGKNLELIIKYDPTDVAKLWKTQSERSMQDFLVEYAMHHADESWVQVFKLLVARDYMNVRRRQLAEQLTTLKAWLIVE